MKETITKIVWQYSEILPDETMDFLNGIADDYAKVKRQIYERYAGIRNVNRLTPVYTVLNEMRACGLRQQLGLPAVYYELAVADAVSDIKGMWSLLKNRIREKISEREDFSADDRKYLRTVLKLAAVFSQIVNGEAFEVPANCAELEIDVKMLNGWLRRQVRKLRTTPVVKDGRSFCVSPNGYRYGEGKLYLTGREARNRVAVPLKDRRTFHRQIRVLIEENYVRLAIPVECRIRRHEDWQAVIYAHIGYRDMMTLSNGTIYGQGLNRLVTPETERLARKNRERGRLLCQTRFSDNYQKKIRIQENNLGSFKYTEQKRRMRARTKDFINTEIGRLLREEKPAKIVIVKPVVKDKTKYCSARMNGRLSRKFEGYIRERLAFKCALWAVELVQIHSKGTGSVCSVCGAQGERQFGEFVCGRCGYRAPIGLNSAKNIEIKAKGNVV